MRAGLHWPGRLGDGRADHAWCGGRVGTGLRGRVDDRLDPPVVADHVDGGLAKDLLAAAADEGVASARVHQRDGQHRVVDGRHLGVLAEQDPGVATLELDRLQQVRPQPAYLDQAKRMAGSRSTGRLGLRAGRGLGLGPRRRRGRCGGCRRDRRRRRGGGGRLRGGRRRGRPRGRGPGGVRRQRLAHRWRLGRPPAGSASSVGGSRRGAVGAATRSATGSGSGAATDGVPSMDIRFSSRSRRAITPWALSSAPGSSTRAQIELEQQSRSGGPLQLGEPLGHEVGGPAEVGAAEPGGLRDEALPHVLGHVDQAAGRRVGDRRDDHEVTQPTQQVLGEAPRVLPGLDDLVDHPENRAAVVGGERVDHLVEEGVGREPEQAGREVVGHPVRSRTTHQLVQHRQRVPRRPAAGAHDERQRGRVDVHALLVADLGQVRRQRARRDQPERVVVGSRADRADDLLGLGGREHELEVLGRLLHELEQRVEALRGDHVGLVDDVDLVATVDRGEERSLAQVAGVVHTAVAGRVDLDHVDRAGPTARQVAAGLADPARGVGRALLAVEAAGQDPRAGRLAAATRSGEQVGMVHPVALERGPKRRR